MHRAIIAAVAAVAALSLPGCGGYIVLKQYPMCYYKTPPEQIVEQQNKVVSYIHRLKRSTELAAISIDGYTLSLKAPEALHYRILTTYPEHVCGTAGALEGYISLKNYITCVEEFRLLMSAPETYVKSTEYVEKCFVE